MTCNCGARSGAACVCAQRISVIGIDWLRRDMQAQANARFRASIRLGDPKDESWNLTGANIKMDVRPKPGGSAILSISTTGGFIGIIDAESRVIVIDIPQEVMAGRPAGDWLYDLLVTTSEGWRMCRARGRFTIYAGITQP